MSSTTYPRVLILGDSLTWGSVATQPNSAFPWLIINSLRGRGSNQANFYLPWGSPGITIAGATSDLQQMALAPTVDLAIIELGSNDWGQNNVPANFQAQYVSYLGLIRASSPNALIVGLNCWQDSSALNGIAQPVSLYNAIIADAITNHSGTSGTHATVDLSSLYLTSSYHNTTGDTYHPNDAGHSAIASAVLAVIP